MKNLLKVFSSYISSLTILIATVEIAELKVLDLQFLKVLVSVRLSLRLCKIIVQFVTFLYTLNPFSIAQGGSVCFLT